MAYNSKRLQTFKWCESVAKNSRFDVMVRRGSIYVTDEIMLAKIDYPEFHNLSEWEWSRITRYTDETGHLLEIPEIEVLERQFLNVSIFDNMFVDQLSCFDCFDCCFNPKLMRKIVKPFEINNIFPTLCTTENKIQLDGCSKDVSIRACMMGVRRK